VEHKVITENEALNLKEEIKNVKLQVN